MSFSPELVRHRTGQAHEMEMECLSMVAFVFEPQIEAPY